MKRARTPVSVATLLDRLAEADQLELASRVAASHGIDVRTLLERRPPRRSAPIIDLYVALSALPMASRRIAELTGRDSSSVRHALRYRAREDARARRAAVEKGVRARRAAREALTCADVPAMLG